MEILKLIKSLYKLFLAFIKLLLAILGRLEKFLLNLTFFIVIAGFFVMMYWGFKSYDPVYVEEPVKVISETFKRGEPIRYSINYCFEGNYPIKIDRRLKCSTEYPFPLVVNYSQKGCYYNEILSTPPIPLEAEAGNCELILRGIYQVNPIREVAATFVTEQFDIVE